MSIPGDGSYLWLFPVLLMVAGIFLNILTGYYKQKIPNQTKGENND